MADEQNRARFQRWYDKNIQLSELVADMSALSPEGQVLFAYLIDMFCDRVVQVKGNEFFSELDWATIRGIYKSKGGRRWYDQEPTLQKAFNKLYSLNEFDQDLVARELYIPSRAVKDYEIHCQSADKPIDLDIVCQIVESIFKEDEDAARRHYLG